MEKLKCTSCNGDLEVEENGKYATCKFCGTKYKLDGDKVVVINVGDVMTSASKTINKALMAPLIIFIGAFIFIATTVFVVFSNTSDYKVDEYNLELKYGEGTQNGVFVQDTLNKVNSKNKTSEHKITVKYNDKETQDEDTIIDIKHSLKSLKDYEVKYEYDSKGYINKIIIEDIK